MDRSITAGIDRLRYNSRSAYDSHLGLGWAFNHDRRLFQYPDGSVGVRTGCGTRTFFVETGGAFVTPTGGLQGTLVELPNGSFEFQYNNGGIDHFDTNGRLMATVSPEGHSHEYLYDLAGSLPLTGTSLYSVDPDRPMTVAYMPRLTRIQARSIDGQLTGDAVDLYYDSTTGRLIRVESSDGQEVHYTHDTTDGLTRGQLLTVTGLDDLYYAYGYDDPDHPHKITSIQFGLAATPVINTYDPQGRVVTQTHGDSVLTFDYQVALTRTRVTRTILDDQGQPLHSTENTVWFDPEGYFEKEVNPLGHEWRLFRDGNKNLTREELWANADSTLSLVWAADSTYDSQGRRLSRTVELDSGEILTGSWTYDHGWMASEQVVSSADPGRLFRTEYTFHRDANNRPTNIHEVKRRNDDGSFSITTYSYCQAADVSGGICPFEGLLKAVDGPRSDVSDVTTYAYYQTGDQSGCTSGGPCHKKGDLHTLTNALGHVTEFTRYDPAGRVTEIKDPNDVTTSMTYHARGWLLSRTVHDPVGTAHATTTYTYDDRGNPTRVTLPDGSFMDYTYNGRDQLVEVADSLGNRIEYVLDSEGKRLAENIYDPQDVLTRTMSMEYNVVQELQASLNAQAAATLYAYDAAGNPLKQTDPLGVETDQVYDALNRLILTLQDVGGIEAETAFHYDAMGNLTEVVDPKGLSTHYTYDARGNLVELNSPDTGITTYVYDPADNQIAQTDARGVTAEYNYDALNRLTAVEYPDSSLDVTYHYDEDDNVTGCTDSYPAGRLTRMIDPSGTTVWCYDARGNVVRKYHQEMDAGIRYQYDLADRPSMIIYPNGERIGYVRDAAGQVSTMHITDGMSFPVALVTDVQYLPFGPVASYTLGPTSSVQQTLERSHDLDYRITDVTSPALELHFRRDAAGNIDRLGTAPGAVSPVEEYLYDDLYRLLAVQDDLAADIETYAYDLIGNRQSKTSAAGTELYDYAIGSHHLIEVGGSGRTYDAVGNLIADQSDNQTYTYDDHNRLVGYSRPGLSASYTYNGRGERVAKFVMDPGQTSWTFLYDEAGRLLAEHSASVMSPPPHFYRKYVYLDDIPVALIDYDQKVYYLHADHLGTPRAVTDGDAVLRWEWQFKSNPFGELLPDEDPESTGSFTLNLRFPGQYFDAESGLHYNYFRDYEPGTGRYVQSDLIGLDGGISTYGYASLQPLTSIDYLGLRSSGDDGFFPGPNICLWPPCGCNELHPDGCGGTATFDGLKCCMRTCALKFARCMGLGAATDPLFKRISRCFARAASTFGNAQCAAELYVCLDECDPEECR